MKVIVGDKVYLQKYDLVVMINEFSAVPGCIMVEAFSRACVISTNGGDDAASFGFCFDKPETVQFLKECDWILDFTEYSQKSFEELKALHDKCEENLDREVDDFNGSDVEYRKEHFDECSEKFDHMKLKLISLDLLMDCKNGKIQMPAIPDENTKLEGNGFKSFGGSEFGGIRVTVESASKKQGFFRRFFKRGAQ